MSSFKLYRWLNFLNNTFYQGQKKNKYTHIKAAKSVSSYPSLSKKTNRFCLTCIKSFILKGRPSLAESIHKDRKMKQRRRKQRKTSWTKYICRLFLKLKQQTQVLYLKPDLCKRVWVLSVSKVKILILQKNGLCQWFTIKLLFIL